MRRIAIFLLALIFMPVSALSQGQDTIFSAWSRLLSPEKVYLHTDREVYNIGDTIWFRGYLKNVSDLAVYPECNYLYVELSSARWEHDFYKGTSESRTRVRHRVKVKRDAEGRFLGYLPLTEDLNTGLATLRAYSYWMLNSDPAYMYTKNIELRNPMKDSFVEDMVALRHTDQRTYDEIGVDNPFRKRILQRRSRSESDIDVQFLPESGRYLAGRPSVIAVKAVGEDGLGIPVSGSILADGVQLATFQTNAFGMGKFTITVPKETKELKAVTETAVETFQYESVLPLPETAAVTLQVEPDTSGVWIRVADAGLSVPSSAELVVHDRSGIVLRSPYGECGKGKRVSYVELEPGINNAAVVDESGNVYAERAFFVFPRGKVTCDVSFDKRKYGRREKVSATVRLREAGGQPIAGDFSLSVTDEGYAPYSGEGHTVESWLLLGSELRGLVEKPQRYFADSIPLAQRIAEVDVLMLTQGWKYYELEKILQGRTERPAYGKEYTQSLSGYVTGVLGRKSKRATLCFVAQKIGYSQIADIDSTAYFSLSNLDFPDSTEFIVGAQGKGKVFQKWYQPVLNPEYYAADYSYPEYLKLRGYDAEYGQYAQQSYYAEDGSLVYTLAPARIVAQKPNISPFPYDEFRPGEYRDEKSLTPYGAYDLVTYIYTTCPGVKYSETGRLVSSSATRVSSNMSMTVTNPEINIYMNGFLVSQDAIESVMMSEVEAFVYINGVHASKYDPGFARREVSEKPVPVVLVTTRFPVRHAPNITADRPLGWQQPARFYTPKYESAASKARFEPMRATLHWEPVLHFENGTARFEFYTSDHQAPYRIVLEGILADGTPANYTWIVFND